MTSGTRGSRRGHDLGLGLSPPVSTESAPHYAWGSTCDGWRLLVHDGLSVIQERVPPGAGETWHVHTRSRQFFYALSGRIAIDRGDGAKSLRAGEGLHVPPGVPHRVWNESGEDALFLVISSPSTAGDRAEAGPARHGPRGPSPA